MTATRCLTEEDNKKRGEDLALKNLKEMNKAKNPTSEKEKISFSAAVKPHKSFQRIYCFEEVQCCEISTENIGVPMGVEPKVSRSTQCRRGLAVQCGEPVAHP